MKLSLDDNDLIEKVKAILPALEKRGQIYLFAFAQQPEIDRWDIVLSSEWSDKDPVEAVRFVADYMRPRFSIKDLTLISRIAVLSSSEPKVHELTSRWAPINPEDNLVDYSERVYSPHAPGEFLGSEVRLVFVFKVSKVPIVDSAWVLNRG